MANPNPVMHQVLEWEAPSSPPKRNRFSKPAFLSSFRYPQTRPVGKESGDTDIAEQGITQPSQRVFSRRFIPQWCTRRNRKVILGCLGALALLIFALGLGLGLGLKSRSKKHRNLPLPSDKSTFNGDLTYYSPGPGYGACGYENKPSDKICAVSHLLWDAVSTSSNPNNNPLCGKMIRITRDLGAGSGNRSIDVEVVDRCTGCLETDLDLSLDMFEVLADESQGRVVGSWAWLN